MSTNPIRDQVNANLVRWYARRVRRATHEITILANVTRELAGDIPPPVPLTELHDELLELRAAVEALSTAADDLERGAAALREEGQP